MIERAALRLLVALGYTSSHVPTPIGPIHVLDREGSGSLPPVVLVHGFGASALSWVPLVRALRGHVSRVTAIDLPGHGFSTRPDPLTEAALTAGVLAAMDAVHQTPALVVGNSLGGVAVVRYANARPERILGTVLLSPAGAPMTSPELSEVQQLFAVKNRAEARVFFGRLLAREPGPIARWLLSGNLLRLLADPRLQGFLGQVSPDQFLAPAEVSSLPGSATLVWGAKDRILPRTALPFWRAHLPPGARVLEPDALGHSPQFDDARATAEIVLDALRGS